MGEELLKKALENVDRAYKDVLSIGVETVCKRLEEVSEVIEMMDFSNCEELKTAVQQFKQLTTTICEGFKKCSERFAEEAKQKFLQMIKEAIETELKIKA